MRTFPRTPHPHQDSKSRIKMRRLEIVFWAEIFQDEIWASFRYLCLIILLPLVYLNASQNFERLVSTTASEKKVLHDFKIEWMVFAKNKIPSSLKLVEYEVLIDLTLQSICKIAFQNQNLPEFRLHLQHEYKIMFENAESILLPIYVKWDFMLIQLPKLNAYHAFAWNYQLNLI